MVLSTVVAFEVLFETQVSGFVFEGNDFEEVRPTEAERLVREDEDGDWDAARDSENDLELRLRV